MAEDYALFSVQDAKRINKAVIAHERQRPAQLPAVRHSTQREPDLCIMLLDDLDSGSSGKATVLAGNSLTYHQILTFNGDPEEASTFSITWGRTEWGEGEGETVEDISIHATPEELLNALLGFSFVNRGDVLVQCGNHQREISRLVEQEDGSFVESFTYSPYRWFITFTGRLEGVNLPLMEPQIGGGAFAWMSSEKTVLYDSGATIDVISPLPTGQNIAGNTIMKRGSIGMVTWVDSLGWSIHALEVRSLDYY